MVIYLPQHGAHGDGESPLLDELTPREIVRELDKYVIGQADAKKAVAIALRNRVRRQKLDPDMADDVMPKNILMIGSTGVGKTEIARRLAKLANSPFLKVEASKFTEVGYVGRDVESMIRDLVEIAIDMVREERLDEVADRAERHAEDRLLELLLPAPPENAAETAESTREKLREKFRAGKLDDKQVEIDVKDRGPMIEFGGGPGPDEMDVSLKEVLPALFGNRTKKRKMRVSEAFDYLVDEEEQKLIDMDQVQRVAIERVERNGMIFLDEIDKIAGRERAAGYSADCRRNDGEYALWLCADRSYSLHRRRGVSCIEAKRSDSRAAGPFPDPRGAEVADRGRLHPDSEGAEKRADQAEPGAARHRGHQAELYRRRAGGTGAVRRAGERAGGEHRRPAAAHDSRKGARGDQLRGAGPQEEDGED
jgi:hypothetical protein